MAKFVLKSNYFEFDSCFKQQMSGAVTGNKFVPPYACTFLNKVESALVVSRNTKPWFWMRYIDGIFFIWTETEDELESFLQCLNAFHPNLKFNHEKSKVPINFLDVTFNVNGAEFKTGLYCKLTDCHQLLEFNSAHLICNKKLLYIAKGCALKGCVARKIYLRNNLKIYVLGLTSVVISRDLLAINLRCLLKTKQSSYLSVI